MRKPLAREHLSREKRLGHPAPMAILTAIAITLLAGLLGPSRWLGPAQARSPENESTGPALQALGGEKAKQGHSSAKAQQICWAEMMDDPLETFDIPNTPRPAYLESTIDPIFGTRLTRITGDPGSDIVTADGAKIGTWGDVAKHHYAKDQPWNADETLIHLSRNVNGSPGDLFLDGETYQVRFARSVPGHDNRWHPVDPALKVYVDGNGIGTFNVYTGAQKVIRTFAEYTRLDMGPWEGNLSYDGKMVALYAKRPDGGNDVFAYDLNSNVKYPVKDLGTTSIDWASISASGNYVVIMYGDTDTQVYDLSMGLLSRFTVNHNHYDLGLDLAGEDVAAGISKNSSYDGLVIAHRLKDAAFSALTTGGYAIHTSTRNNLLPGWAYSSFHPTRARYRDEIVAISTDGKEAVRRFGHMHNNQTDYLAEAMPVPSHDGKRVLFSSNWNASNGRPVGAYVFDARVACETEPSPTPSVAHPSATAMPSTQAPTHTPMPATATATSAPPPTETPTNTPVPPTPTHTNTPVPPTATPTNTPVPPTATPTNTPLPPTEAPTNTPLPPTEAPTIAPLPTAIPTGSPPPTEAPTNTATAAPPTAAPTETATETNAPTSAPTPTTTHTPTTAPEDPTAAPSPTSAPTAHQPGL